MDEIVWDNVHPTTDVRLDRSSYQRGREEERAAVLAYLGALRPYPGGAYAYAYAKAIEDGEHLEPPAAVEGAEAT